MVSESRLYRPEIEYAANQHGLDPDLVEAVVRVESSGLTHAYRYEPDFFKRYLEGHPDYAGLNPRRCSASYGLLQVMFSTARERGLNTEPEFLFVPSIGLEFGCRHLAHLIRLFPGDLDKAIAAYNTGAGNVRNGIHGAGAIYLSKVKTALAAIRSGS